MRKKLLIAGAGFILSTIALVVWFPVTKRTLPADAVKIRYLGPLTPEQARGYTSTTPITWAATVILSNTTAKTVWVTITGMQSGSGGRWTNYAEAIYTMTVKPPPHHELLKNIGFAKLPPAGRWRFRMIVSEKATGVERTRLALLLSVQKLLDRLRGRPARMAISPFAATMEYRGAEHEVFSQEFE